MIWMPDDVGRVLTDHGCTSDPCGSRVTCDPPPMNTDMDFLVEVPSDFEEEEGGMARVIWDLIHIGFIREGNAVYARAAEDFGFVSMRRGNVNLIMTDNQTFLQRHRVATHVCRRLNVMAKPDRIAVFQAVLYGKAWTE